MIKLLHYEEIVLIGGAYISSCCPGSIYKCVTQNGEPNCQGVSGTSCINPNSLLPGKSEHSQCWEHFCPKDASVACFLVTYTYSDGSKGQGSSRCPSDNSCNIIVK